MKSYTDIEQSKKLAEILPIESADMWWSYFYNVISDTGGYDKEPMLHKPICDPNKAIPCWSLASLLSVIPKDEHLTLMMNAHLKWVCDINKTFIYEPTVGDDLLDAVFEMILKLHELKVL